MLPHGGHELLGFDVGPQVNGLKARAFQHHLD